MASASELDGQLKAIYAQLESGMKEQEAMSGDAPKATAHLKAMTNKMAESKRLIKEFEKAALEDASMDPSATAARKKDMVVQLNRFVNMKKAAAAVIAAKAAAKAEKAQGKAAATDAAPAHATAPPVSRNPLFGGSFKAGAGAAGGSSAAAAAAA
eukprot:CAMPEP_0197609206 /NCGR_PEP_ID=MMETSP1326-20131121/50701_1 /TAXON_ID=1155430 /ORGANISM="Genus nov. species nov., Strain RCC2288" /LENGTH=154 /DNA_ID=CAMNT_0043177545 /DNA_START=65 /DNA_END=526 /DNA_ORIENTATION=+